MPTMAMAKSDTCPVELLKFSCQPFVTGKKKKPKRVTTKATAYVTSRETDEIDIRRRAFGCKMIHALDAIARVMEK